MLKLQPRNCTVALVVYTCVGAFGRRYAGEFLGQGELRENAKVEGRGGGVLEVMLARFWQAEQRRRGRDYKRSEGVRLLESESGESCEIGRVRSCDARSIVEFCGGADSRGD